MNRLLRDEDTLRRRILDDDAGAGDVPVEVPGVRVPEPGGEADADPEPELRTPEMIAEPPAESTGGLRRLSRPGLHKVMQALYAAGTNKPLDRSFWDEPKDVLAAKSDPLLAIKEQLYQTRIDKLKQQPPGKSVQDDAAARQAIVATRPDVIEKLGNGDIEKGKALALLVPAETLMKIAAGSLQVDKFGEQKTQNVRRAKEFAARYSANIWAANGVQDRASQQMLKTYGEAIKADVPIVSTLEQIDRSTFKEMPDGSVVSLARGWVPKDVDTKTVPTLDEWSRLKLNLMPGGSGTQVTPDDKVHLLSQVKMLYEMFARGLAGAQFTPEEMKRFATILNDASNSSEQAMAMSIDLVRRVTADKLRHREAEVTGPGGVSEQGWREFAARGGITTRMPLFSDIYDAPLEEAGRVPAPRLSDFGLDPTAGPNATPPAVGTDVTVLEPEQTTRESPRPRLPARPAQTQRPAPAPRPTTERSFGSAIKGLASSAIEALGGAPSDGKVLMSNPKTGETARVDRDDIEAARLDGFVEVPGGR
jgi:hypothetical protein